MCQRVSDCSETSFQEHGESLMLGLLCFRSQGVERQHRGCHRKYFFDQNGAITISPGKIAYALGQPLCGLKYGVEVVVLEQFGPTVLHDFRMELPPVKLRL